MPKKRRGLFGREPKPQAQPAEPLAPPTTEAILEAAYEPEQLERLVLEVQRAMEPIFQALVNEYFTPDREAARLLDMRTANRLEDQETDDLRLSGFTRKKLGSAARFNEDSFRLGENWYAVGDGIGGSGKGRAGLLGEATAATAAEMMSRISQLDRANQASRKLIREAMWRIPELVKAMATPLGNHPAPFADGKRVRVNDLATTAEVAYASARHERVFLLHVGDSRTFWISPDRTEVKQLTTDHEEPHYGWLTSSIALDHAPNIIDVADYPFPPGSRLVSITDGVFNAYERGYSKEKFLAEFTSLVDRRLPDLMEELHNFGSFNQQMERYPDDLTGAGMERK